jgi:hypothetical protein
VTTVIDVLHAAARVLLLLAVGAGSAVLLWGLLREPIGQLRGRLASESAAADTLSSDDDAVPGWAALVGVVLLVAFVYLSASAYFGLPSLSR